MKTILACAANLAKPSMSDFKKVEKIANEILDNIKQFNDSRIKEVSLGGSFGKGTWLADTDIDFFVSILPSVDRNEFENLGKSVGYFALSKYHPYLRYSEHPYVEAIVGTTKVNIVPCYNVTIGNWKSSADRSPYHTSYMKENLNTYLIEQVRLLKKFLKSIGVYGSQLAISGFSGYVTEVLILKFTSFIEVLNFMANIGTERTIISLDNKASIDAFNSKLIILDPIDEKRNLGAAISSESLAKFILTARNFLNRPSIAYFEDEISKCEIRDLRHNLLIVEFSVKKRSPDILWGQLKRKLAAISRQLSMRQFDVIKHFCYTNERDSAVFFFILKSPVLSAIEVKRGPDIFRRNETSTFLNKRSHDSILFWTDDRMNIFTLNKGSNMTAKECMKQLLLEDMRLNTKGVSIDFASGFEVYMGNEKELNRFVLTAFDMLNKGNEKTFRIQ